jgi:tetratricopeptide (TPR) repeat protein
MRRRAERLNAKAIDLEEKGWAAEAEDLYRKAAKADPSWSVPWFNLGLLAKRQRRWADSREHNRAALALDAGDEGAWWNLGIAATALGVALIAVLTAVALPLSAGPRLASITLVAPPAAT